MNSPRVDPPMRRILGAISLLAALIAIFTFSTGWTSLREAMRGLTSALFKSSAVEIYDISSPALVPSLSATTFEIQIGKSGSKFSYSRSGDVSYNGKYFDPNVHFTPIDNPAVLISVPDALHFVTVVGLDRDGQRSLFVADLVNYHSIFAKQPARDVYWSPDRRHVVTLNAYEAQWFASIDLKTGGVVDGPTLGAKDTHWYLEGDLHWAPDGRAFLAKVVETVNVYEGGDITKGPLNTFAIAVDTASLKMKTGPTKHGAG